MKGKDTIITEAMIYVTFFVLIMCLFIILFMPSYEFVLPRITTPIVFLWGVRLLQSKSLMFCGKRLLASILTSSIGILVLYILYIFVHISPFYHAISSMCFDICTAGLFVSICLGICEITKEKILNKKIIKNYLEEKKKNMELSAELQRLKVDVGLNGGLCEHHKQ